MLTIKQQKLYYKDSIESVCVKCINADKDCDDTSKLCGKDKKTGMSFVINCGSFNKQINQHREEITLIAEKQESRIEMMGGGYVE